MKRGVSPLALSLVLTFGCAPPAPPPVATHPATAPGTPALGVTLVESWPLETKLAWLPIGAQYYVAARKSH